MRITFDIAGVPPATVTALLAPLLTIDCAYLRAHPATPRLYSSGVRYRRERWGREVWRDVSKTLAAGDGDCEDLAAWRCAELRIFDRRDARLLLRWKVKDGRPLYHVLVALVDRGGSVVTVEDPSRRLGMK